MKINISRHGEIFILINGEIFMENYTTNKLGGINIINSKR